MLKARPARPGATRLKYPIVAAIFQKLCPWSSDLKIRSGPGVRRDLNIRLILMYHQSCFTFAESGFDRSGPGLKCLKRLKLIDPSNLTRIKVNMISFRNFGHC